MPEKKQRNFRLADSASVLLSKAVGAGSMSAYIERVILQRWQQWNGALRVLQERGWEANELRVACHALNGHSWPTANVAAALADADPLQLQANDVTAANWSKRALHTDRDRDEALALLILAAELWAGSAAVARALEGEQG